jgi:phenylalanyl-tRNA synthetase beta chain
VGADFFDLKGVVESLLHHLDLQKVIFAKLPDDACAYTRPGVSARILVQEREIGLIGEIHPLVLRRFELKRTAYIFELAVDRLLPLIPDTTAYRPTPKFPLVTRDVTLIIDRRVESGKILHRIEQMGEELIEALHLFDVFEGKPIPEGRKSLSVRIVYRSSTRTLEDEEVTRLHQKVTGHLLEEFKASLPA